MPAFYLILETLLNWNWYRKQVLLQFFFCVLNRSKTLSFHRCLQFWDEDKVSGGQVRWIRWKTHAQASICEQVRYHGARSMIVFSIILWVSDDLLRANGAYLQGSISYWQYDLVARIHDAPRHCSLRKQWAKPSHFTELDVLFSVLALLVIPQLNLCSARRRIAKRHSQHFKCPCTFNFIFYTKVNTVSLIYLFE